MNEHNITNESLALAMMLVVVAILISNKEKLALEKDILWSVCRAVVQLIIVGYVLKYIFGVNHSILTLLMVLFICFNAAYNAQKRSKYIDKAFLSSFIAITVERAPFGAGSFRLYRVHADAGHPDLRHDCRQCDGGGGAVLQQFGAAV